tara:strand:+ start:1857 stop:2099 length:243 start_codon:yes stop_codon:yes gene_type:complete
MARTQWAPGIYSLNNIDTGINIECTVDDRTIFIPPSSSVTVVAKNYISRLNTLVKLEISYIGQVGNAGALGISGNITQGT